MTGFYYEDETFEQLQMINEDLSKKEFVECTFRHCDLSEADLSGSDFIDCHFLDSNLSMMQVTGTGFKNVDFENCKILGVDFQVCSDFLLQLAFKECQLDFSNFHQMKLSQTPFINCRMESVELQEADLSGAVFTGSSMLNAQFYSTNLEGSDFRETIAYIINPNQNRVKGAKFSLEGVAGLLQQYQIEID